MSAPRLRPVQLFSATMMRALPGIAALAMLVVLDVLAPLWAFAGMVGCSIIAAFFAVPVARDLAALAAYADALSRTGEVPPPRLSEWQPASELAAAMRRIAQSKARQRRPEGNVFAYLPQPLLALNPERRIVAINTEAQKLIGAAPIGGDLAVAFRDPDVLEAADEVRMGGGARSVSFTVAGAVDRFYAAEIVPFEHPTAEGATMLLALYDLTEHRRAEQLRADFVANASHELRTPLATLIGFIETLRGPARDDTEAQQRFLALMHETSLRMARLVQDLLSLSRIEMEEHSLPRTRVDLVRVAGTVAAGLQLSAGKKDMRIVVKADPDAPEVLGDADQLAQLLQNLIDNSVKYGRAETEIAVRIQRRDPPPASLDLPKGSPPAVEVTVSDHSDGIAPEHLPRLTERFYRVDAARSRAIGGTGLGLAIVKHIVTRHRGEFDIDSTLGKGSVFSVLLPGVESKSLKEKGFLSPNN